MSAEWEFTKTRLTWSALFVYCAPAALALYGVPDWKWWGLLTMIPGIIGSPGTWRRVLGTIVMLGVLIFGYDYEPGGTIAPEAISLLWFLAFCFVWWRDGQDSIRERF